MHIPYQAISKTRCYYKSFFVVEAVSFMSNLFNTKKITILTVAIYHCGTEIEFICLNQCIALSSALKTRTFSMNFSADTW